MNGSRESPCLIVWCQGWASNSLWQRGLYMYPWICFCMFLIDKTQETLWSAWPGAGISFSGCTAHCWRAVLGIRPQGAFLLSSWLTSLPFRVLLPHPKFAVAPLGNCLTYYPLEIKNKKGYTLKLYVLCWFASNFVVSGPYSSEAMCVCDYCHSPLILRIEYTLFLVLISHSGMFLREEREKACSLRCRF